MVSLKKYNKHSLLNHKAIPFTNPVLYLESEFISNAKDHFEFLDALEINKKILERLLQEGISIPPFTLNKFKENNLIPRNFKCEAPYTPPRVVGLLVYPETRVGLITPLAAERSPQWEFSPTLPPSAKEIPFLLAKIFRCLEMPFDYAVPERFAFKIGDKLNIPIYGRSMDVAIILAIIDTISNRRNPLLSAACAVVEFDDERLRPVNHITIKLDAFLRECERGSLLIRTSKCKEAAQYDRKFKIVWKVDNLKDLALYMQKARLLDNFFIRSRISSSEFYTIFNLLETNINIRFEYKEALELAIRMEKCGYQPQVPKQKIAQVKRYIADLYRHLGNFEQAILYSKQALQEIEKIGKLGCYEEKAEMVLDYASSFYDAHNFLKIIKILTPWIDLIKKDPLKLSVSTRCKIYNTIACSQVIVGDNYWKKLFLKSLDLQKKINSNELQKTINYYIHSLLRVNQLKEAEKEIKCSLKNINKMDDFSKWMLSFYQAELFRRKSQIWQDPEVDKKVPNKVRVGHPFGYYFQATARQKGRSIDDVCMRFEKASEFFSKDLDENKSSNILTFLYLIMKLGVAAYSSDKKGWITILKEIKLWLNRKGNNYVAEYYAPVLNALTDTIDIDLLEKLFQRVPYF